MANQYMLMDLQRRSERVFFVTCLVSFLCCQHSVFPSVPFLYDLERGMEKREKENGVNVLLSKPFCSDEAWCLRVVQTSQCCNVARLSCRTETSNVAVSWLEKVDFECQ